MSAGPVAVAVAVAVQLELDHVQMRRPDADTFDIDIRHLLLLSSNTRRNFKLALSVFRAERHHTAHEHLRILCTSCHDVCVCDICVRVLHLVSSSNRADPDRDAFQILQTFDFHLDIGIWRFWTHSKSSISQRERVAEIGHHLALGVALHWGVVGAPHIHM